MANLNPNFNPSLKLITTPSECSLTDPRLSDSVEFGNPALHELMLSALLNFYKKLDPDEKPMICGKSLHDSVRNHNSDSFGPFNSVNYANEKTISGLFASHLQHLFSTQFATEEEKSSFTPLIEVTGQNTLGAGSMDVTIYRRDPLGHHPRVIFEFSTSSAKRQDSQLFAHVNNSDRVLLKGHQMAFIGLVVGMKYGEVPTLTVNSYLKIAHEAVPKIAVVPIYTGEWSTESVARVLQLLDWWMHLDTNNFLLPESGLLQQIPHLQRTVLRTDNMVFKTFDYRQRGEPVGAVRRAAGSLRFISGCIEVLKCGELTVIQYPFIAGSHCLHTSHGVTGVLDHLAEVHSAGYLHMDIKLHNCVFNAEDGNASRLIDFDFCQREDIATYPLRYNTEITDGKRHPLAQPGARGQKTHDCYSLAAVMRLFQPVETDYRNQWTDWCVRVERGDLQAVAQDIGAHAFIKVELMADVVVKTNGGAIADAGPGKDKKRALTQMLQGI